MNLLLLKNRPEDIDREGFEKMWNAAGYTLEALYKTLVEMKNNSSRVKEDDFSVPNHYALLAYDAGKRAAYSEIMDMLPKTSKE